MKQLSLWIDDATGRWMRLMKGGRYIKRMNVLVLHWKAAQSGAWNAMVCQSETPASWTSPTHAYTTLHQLTSSMGAVVCACVQHHVTLSIEFLFAVSFQQFQCILLLSSVQWEAVTRELGLPEKWVCLHFSSASLKLESVVVDAQKAIVH